MSDDVPLAGVRSSFCTPHPRTHSNRASKPSETYLCYTRVRDPERCSQPPVKRGEIDGAVYAYFEKVGLDVEATRAQLS
jgi:hypothetical protein